MYRMDADGVVFHDPSLNDATRLAIGAEATLEINKAGSLTFMLPPGNVIYKALRKRKSVVTLYQGNEIIFRGRVLDTMIDLQSLCEVYCEGELALLIDSLQPPIEYKGSAAGYFMQMVASHNATMDADKQFVVGEVSAVTSEHEVNVETDEYRETLEEMRSLLVDEFGGYLRVRYSGGTRYLDYIKEYNSSSSQRIQFGVNLVDIENRNDTVNLCTVLVPMGKKGLTIESVNGGSVYLQDAQGIAQYGRIEKVKRFENIEVASELLEYGQKALEQMKAERSIVVKAVDMQLVNGYSDSFTLGDRVWIESSPHDVSESELCTKAVIKLDTPDQSEYTFGTPAEKLTDNVSNLKKKTDSEYDKLKDWLTVTDTELILAKQWISEAGDVISNVLFKMDAMNANIQLKADQTVLTELETRVSNAEIMIDGANAAIDLKADRTTMTALETRMTAAEILIDGANAQIGLMAAQATVDALGERVKSAELLIDGQNSKIAAKADLILLDGYVKASELETEVLSILEYAWANDLDVQSLVAGSVNTNFLSADSISTDSLTVGGTTFNPSDYATKAWVEDQGYLKNADFSNYATRSWVIEQNYTTASDVAQTLDGYVMTGELSGYATEEWVRENFSKASATYMPTVIERYGSVSGNSIPVRALNESGTVLLTGTVDAGDVYSSGVSSGKNSVTLTSSGWQGSSNTVRASNGKSVVVNLPSFSVSGGTSFNSSNQTTVYFSTASVSGYLASKTVDATTIYNKGWNACRDACTLTTSVYTISEHSPGTLYMKVGNNYTSVGSSWVKVKSAVAYNRPAAKS